MSSGSTTSRIDGPDAVLSLYHLLDPEVLANPYPLFHRLRRKAPVQWDPFLHAWIVTRYNDVLEVLHTFSADRTPTPEQLSAMGLTQLNPIAQVMVKQMLFMDAGAHTRLRGLASKAFTPARVEQLREHIGEIVNRLLDGIEPKGSVDIISEFAEPLPAIVTAELLGVPVSDWQRLKAWSANFAEMLGNFQHNPEHAPKMLQTVEEMTGYFRDAVREITAHPREGLIHSLITAEIDGDRLTEEEVIANSIVTMVGGQETTTNLIGNGLLTLLRNPGEMERLNSDLSLVPSAVEEMLRYESPSQHTARLAPSERELGGKQIQKRQAVIAVMAAANRDPERFPDPDRFDITRTDNRHLAFGYAAHFCFGAPLARAEGQIAFEHMLRRLRNLRLEPQKLVWRTNLGLRGLVSLKVNFDSAKSIGGATPNGRSEQAKPQTISAPQASSAKIAEASARNGLVEKYLNQRVQQNKIGKRASSGPAPLSFPQQQIWLHAQIAPEVPVYNEPVTIYRDGPLDLAVLEKCFAEVMRRHEAWRTTFDVINGEPVQIVNPVPSVNLPLVDLRNLPESERDGAALQLATEDARRPFDLKQCPLLRALVVRLADEEYRIYLTLHHMIFDGVSIYRVFLPELAVLYDAFSRGQQSPLPDLPIQYADFAQWQRDYLRNGVLAKHLDYWREKLSGDLPTLELPTDYARPAVQSFRGAIQTLHLSKQLSEQLKALSKRENSTLFITLLAAFKTLLHRYTGQDDIVIGTLAGARKRSEFENLLGCFQNPVVLRSDFAGDPSFRKILAQVRETTLGALQHDEVPFELVVKELHTERDLSRNPLAQVAFTLVPQVSAPSAEWSAGQWDVETGAAKFDLYLEMEDEAEGLTARFMYRTDLFSAETISRLQANFTTLLEGIAANPAESVATLPLLTEKERNQLLVEWNDTRVEYPASQCLYDLVKVAAQQSPNSIAVKAGSESVTYQELERRSGQVAARLREAGVRPDVAVGLYFERSIEMIVGILGALKAGGACLPLDPTYPGDRLAFMLAETHAPVLLTQSQLLSRLPSHNAQVVCVDTIQGGDEAAFVPAASPESMAYYIYTSGSTGQPKGVRVTHRGLVNSTLARTTYYAQAPKNFLLLSSFAFDSSLAGIFWTLATGGTLVLAPDQSRWDLNGLPSLIAKHGVSHLLCVPSLYKAILETGTREELASLQVAIVAGEPCPNDLVSQHFAQIPHAELHNEYGPTEATVWSSAYKCEASASVVRVPIGRPIANTQLYVLDSRMQAVPVGVRGELYVGGVGVSAGYLDRPNLNAQKFVPNPFHPAEKVYRTGDVVRYLSDGNLDWLGRADGQIKLRGFRIELGEIESELSAHPLIRRALVQIREVQPGNQQLVAYVIAGNDKPTVESLREHLAVRLPAYAIPSSFVFLDAMPELPNGKVDLRRLPAPDAASETKTGPLSPRTPAQEVVAGIWAQVLQRDRIGIRDDFFALGGHSLLAAKVISRIASALGVELPLRAIFERPTVEGLAALIESSRADRSASLMRPIGKVSRDTDPPLSFAQERLWFLYQLEPENPLYNVPCAIRIGGPLDVRALEQSINEIIRRHESLRTRFAVSGAQPVQVIVPTLTIPMPVRDLEELPLAEREAEAARLAGEEARRSFNLGAGPLVRASVLRLAPEQHVLLLNIHHIASDETSRDIIQRELVSLYEAFAQGKPSPLPELKTQYADYAAWQRGWLQNGSLERELAHWRSRLEDAPAVLELPTDHSRPAVQSFRGGNESLELDPAVAAALKTLSQREGATLFMTLLAAFNVLLARYSGQQDIVVGAPFTNRQRAEVEGLIGFFVNTVPLRSDLSGNPSFQELLQRVKTTALDAYDHRELPFEKLVEELRPKRNLGYNPLFQVLFAVQNDAPSTEQVAGITLHLEDVNTGTAKFDLTCTCSPTDAGFTTSFEYNTDLFESATIRRMMDSFHSILEAVASDPQQRISALPLLSAKERQKVLLEWNATDAAYPHEKCVHQLVEGQAAQRPVAVAVVRGQERVSYAELNSRANQLAHYLRKRGIRPDVPVGICLESSPELAVALLAVMKAGGACLPLDPAYPKDRLQWMLEDSRAPLLLSREGLVPELVSAQAERICMLSVRAALNQESIENPEPITVPENLAYVIYTSGSTGKPKGVMLTHGGLVNYISGAISLYDLTPNDRVLQFSSISFDIAIEEIFPTWSVGGTLVLRSGSFSVAGGEFLRFAREQKLTFVPLATSYWHELVHELSESGATLPESLRLVAVGGEKTQIEALETWRKLAGGRVRWMNAYGPTETCVIVTACEPSATEALPATLSIGRPLQNVKIYILDRNLQPVPVGVPGELHIGGPGVARGYLNQPELTAEKFVRDPFSSQADARLYKTGDLARYLDNGEIEFIGRRDYQVKIRGFRVELGEIETVLAKHAAVREALVLAREEGLNNKRLIGYVVPAKGASPNAGELRAFLKKQLPDYMVPSDFVMLDEFPLTPNGKVDRNALAVPDLNSSRPAGGFVAPSDQTEATLAAIWEEILGRKPIGIRDNFFELGGHSLLAVRLMRRIEQSFRRKLPLTTLFEAPTIEQFAILLRQEDWRPSQSSLVPIQPKGSRPPFFCVHGLGGTVLRFRDLAEHLGPDQPFYGVQAQGLDGERPFHTRVEEMATFYVKEIRQLQPEGPYYIGGYSLGGLIAFEMARQLLGEGQEVALLALFDAYPTRRDAYDLKNSFTLPLNEQRAYWTHRIKSIRKGVRRRFDSLFLPRPLKEVRRVFAAAEQAYSPQVYFGSATWFRTTEKGLRSMNNPQDDWAKWVTGKVEVYEIEGDHGNVLREPQVGHLAEKLSACLKRAQQNSAKSALSSRAAEVQDKKRELGSEINVPGLSGAELHQILVEWNATEFEYPREKCLHQMIEATAAASPDTIAVMRDREKLTFHELNQRANQLANFLRRQGVGPEVPVGICLESSVDLTISLLGVLKAGGACLPLDPAYPKERLQWMLEDSQAPVLISRKGLVPELATERSRRIDLAAEQEALSRESRETPEPNVEPKSLAYVIYTSGSTGKPKGVMLTHAGLVNYTAAAIRLYGLGSSDRVLQFSSISFDIAIEEIFPTWTAGGTVVLRSGSFSLAGADFLHFARQQKLTVISVATAYWHELVHELSESGAQLPESLRLVIVGGEKAQQQVLETWRKIAGDRVRWVNTYGPTETSVIATSYEPPASGTLPTPLPIGRPIGNMRIYILDPESQPVAVGTQGEVHIGGPGVARGYLNQPDLTATKFVRDPFSADPDSRLYKTGDLARYLPTGEIEFVGRRDFQVKIRGFRVELGEVEGALSKHAAVREALVIAREEGLNNKRLVGYVIPAAGSSPDATELRSFLKSQLPEYMVPSDFVVLDEFPLTPNGKVDRKALPAPQISASADHVAPRNPMETKLVAMWEELLARKPLSVRDNFFEMGGHSLLAVRLMRRIEQAFKRKLPMTILFEAPTVEQFAALLQQERWTPSQASLVPIQPAGDRAPFFCIHGLGGTVLRFNGLARHMGTDRPFYGVQAQGLEGDRAFHTSVEEMASFYIKEIRAFQPAGPYHLGGYSLGGLIAFEMARQLEADGQEVGLLALLDTYPGKPKSKKVLLGTLAKMSRREQLAYVAHRMQRIRKGFRRRFEGLFLPRPLKEVRKVFTVVEEKYRPQTYFGSATWFRATEKGLRGADNSSEDWAKWIQGGVEVHDIAGDHGSILKEPDVTYLAEALRSCLNKVEQERAEPETEKQISS